MIECPHMSGDATCSMCEHLQELESQIKQVLREYDIALRRLEEISTGAASSPQVHAGAAFLEIKESRKSKARTK